MDEKIFLVEEIKDINLEIGAANLFLQRAENQDELKVILAKGEMAHFHVTKQENQLEMSYKKNGKISREQTDEIIVQIPENHHLENMSVSIGAGKLFFVFWENLFHNRTDAKLDFCSGGNNRIPVTV